MIKIHNLRFACKLKHPWEFKVGRTSPVGNPFLLGKESERDLVCDQYDDWFHNAIHTKEFHAYMNKLNHAYNRYGKLDLYCWCSPKRCHAETIKEYLEND